MEPTYEELIQLCYALDNTLTGLLLATAQCVSEPDALKKVATHSMSKFLKETRPNGYATQLKHIITDFNAHIPGVEQL